MDKILDKKLDKHFGNFWRWGGAGGTPLAVTQEDCLVYMSFSSLRVWTAKFQCFGSLTSAHPGETENSSCCVWRKVVKTGLKISTSYFWMQHLFGNENVSAKVPLITNDPYVNHLEEFSNTSLSHVHH